MKKEGIMRINSYNKFFAEVAKIMHTDVKDVKQLDGRYKVELTNHVYVNVYRGVSGTLFIHDYRGNAHITSCYNFEDFKTMKDLYERLITDFGEDSIENVECAKEQYFDTNTLQPNKTIIAKIDNINHCPNQNRFSSIDNLRTNLLQTVRNMAKNGVIEWALVEYVKAKLDNCYLVKDL